MEYLSEKAKEFELEGNKEVFLLVHGFTGSPAHMYPLGKKLNQAGYSVKGVRLPGHGISLEDMEETSREDWLGRVIEEYNALKDKYNKVYVAGLSMGGTISLVLSAEFKPNAVISMAAPIKLQNKLAYLAPVLKYFKKYDTWPESEDKHPYDVGYSGMPVAAIAELLKLIKESKNNLSQITSPTLVIQPKLDETVKPSSGQYIYDNLSRAEEKEILWLKESEHVCTIGPESDIISQKMIQFIEKIN